MTKKISKRRARIRLQMKQKVEAMFKRGAAKKLDLEHEKYLAERQQKGRTAQSR